MSEYLSEDELDELQDQADHGLVYAYSRPVRALIAEVQEHRKREGAGHYMYGCMDTDDGLVWSMFETGQEARDELKAGEVVAHQWRGPWEVVTDE